MTELLVWRPGWGLVPDDMPETPLDAADSWLVRDGRVRAIDRHRERFFQACEQVGATRTELDAFWTAVLDALPRTGSWFPRVEWSAGSPRLRIRPAPALSADVTVRVPKTRDPRTVPRRKGPDVAVLARLRAWALQRGAQEALLLSKSGLLLEAAHSGVLWWEGNRLCAPDPHMAVLDSVTSALIRERATLMGVPVVLRRRPPTHLNGREVWLVNALHGIRPVARWIDAPIVAGRAVRAPVWQGWLDDLSTPLPPRRLVAGVPATSVASGQEAVVAG